MSALRKAGRPAQRLMPMIIWNKGRNNKGPGKIDASF
jgi:hypothetical protein